MELAEAATILYGYDPTGLEEQPIIEEPVNDYESAMVEQARQIVAGNTMLLPTVEHLRVLLEWLDIQAIIQNEGGAHLEGDAPF